MKNKLMTTLMGNTFISTIVKEIGKFYKQNESIILTTGTIGFSLATTGVAMKNATDIHYILADCRSALQNCNTKEERDHLYACTLRALIPLVAPIVIFQGATIGCAVFYKKQADKKLAEAASALSIAQAAISSVQAFQKETEQALGEEKYNQLQDEIYEKKDIDCRRFTAIASEGAPGENLFVDKYSNKPFWSSFTQIEYAAKEMARRLGQNGTENNLCINDFYDLIGNPDLQPNELGKYFGYIAGEEPSVFFSDTHVIFPNGTRVQAAMVHLYPEPEILPDSEHLY